MALDIRSTASDDLVQFEDDGYYWFLHPQWEELAAKTGKYIDLYGDAEFEGDSLRSLLQIVNVAMQRVEKMPNSWDVLTGHRLDRSKKPQKLEPVFQLVRKTEFILLLT